MFDIKLLKNGKIDLNDTLNVGRIKTIPFSTKFYDVKTGKVYYYKANKSSGGHDYTNKSVYESLISRLIMPYTDTVLYYPAVYNNDQGVISVDYTEGAKCRTYILTKGLQKVLKEHKLPLNAEEITDYKSMVNYSSELSTVMSKSSISELKKIPLHFLVGNLDYKTDNIAIYNKTKSQTLDRLLNFDYGFNVFSLIDKAGLKSNFSYNEYLKAQNEQFWKIPKLLNYGMGATAPMEMFDSYEAYVKDMIAYAKENPQFKQCLKTYIKALPEEHINDTIRMMEYEGIKVDNKTKEIVNRVIDFNKNSLSR